MTCGIKYVTSQYLYLIGFSYLPTVECLCEQHRYITRLALKE